MSGEEVLHDETEGDEPSYTELEPAAPSEHDYNMSMSYLSGTSSQDQTTHEESKFPSEEDLAEEDEAVFGGAVQSCLDAKKTLSLVAFSSTPKDKNR